MNTLPHRGQILLVALALGAALGTISLGFVNYETSAIRSSRYARASAEALALAEGGMDKAVYELNQDGSYAGEAATPLGDGAFTTSIATIDSNTKRVTVTASVPGSGTPIATREIAENVSINTSTVSFNFGVQVGQGGVQMSNGSEIIGNIYSDGNISGSGTVTGDATVAGGLPLTADQTWTTQNSSFNLGNISAHNSVAQSFTPSISAALTGLDLYLEKVGAPANLTIRIVTDNAGSPSTNVLASGSVSAAAVTGAYGFIPVTLAGNPNLTAGQKYWIIASASVSAARYFIWGSDTDMGYAGGAAKSATAWNGAWNGISADLDFKAYVGGITTSISGINVQGTAWAHTLSSCTIGGDAYYQTISGCTVVGTSHPGSADPVSGAMPISDAEIADWEATAAAGGTVAGPHTISGTETLGPKEITGNLTINNGGKLILSGPVWVKGNIVLNNNATLTVSPATGNSGAVLIADDPANQASSGIVTLSNGVNIMGNGSADSYPMILSTNTGASAITLNNNSAGVILYASQGTVVLSNNAGANEITAYGLSLSNNAIVTYVNGLQSSSFSSGPGGSWAVVPGTYAITR